METYPHAKVILTVQEPERWYESTFNTIYGTRRTATSPLFGTMGLFVPFVRNMKRATGIVNDLAWKGAFDGRFENREHAVAVFERLNEDVKERVPSERLLVYDVKEGWAPLCEFLGVKAPEDEPFPHLNDTTTFRRLVRRRSAFAYTLAAVIVLAVASALVILRISTRR